MKTEPTEARCHIMTRSFGNGYGDEIMVREDAEEAVNIAFKEGQSSPKIKQLEWVKRTDSLIFTHHVFGVTYCVYEDKEQWWIECQFYNDYECISIDCRDTLDEAKAAAQADFEKRVMECLDL